jgi:hypothetical protein
MALADDLKNLLKTQGPLTAPEALGSPLAAMAGQWEVGGPHLDALKAQGFSFESQKVISRLVLGGRYLETEFSAKTAEGPYAGIAILGYDTVTGQYIETWNDSLGYHIALASKNFEVSRGALTISHEYEGKKYRSEYRSVTTAEWQYRLYQDGVAAPVKEAHFTRQM